MEDAIADSKCPKCPGTTTAQYVNGRDILACDRCNYKIVTGVDPEEERVQEPAPLNYADTSEGFDPGDGCFAEMTRESPLCEFVHEKIIKRSEPRYSNEKLEDVIGNATLRETIAEKIPRLYEYQAEVFRRVTDGQNVVITAPTSSGKTEAFVFPILDRIMSNPNPGKVSALFVYPTRALAEDQLRNISAYTGPTGTTMQKIDGSVYTPARHKILSNPPDILATNFDLLAYHLPRRREESGISRKLVEALSEVKVVVIDEAHTCSGFYGANVRWLLKRLQRMRPGLQFVASSATLDDPEGFCNRLFPVEMAHVNGTGIRGETRLQLLKPATTERALMIDLARAYGTRDLQVLAFTISRNDSELLALDGSNKEMEIEVHKSGMSPAYRMYVEEGLRNDRISAVACTPTLELGINIGNISAVVSTYTPHNRLMQRIGRAGRRGQESYGYMILDEEDAITKYYIDNPRKYFTDKDHHVITFDNPLVDEKQLLCMAEDGDLTYAEQAEHAETADRLEAKGLMNDGSCTDSGRWAVRTWTIRDIGDKVELLDDGYSVGEIEMPVAFTLLYPGAILVHQKTTYRVKKLARDHGGMRAVLAKEDTPNQTIPYVVYDVIPQKTLRQKDYMDTIMEYCHVRIENSIVAYTEKPRNGGQGKSYTLRPAENMTIDTLGIIITFNDLSKMFKDASEHKGPSLHAVGHLLVHAARMIIGAEIGEIDGMDIPNKDALLLYDNSMKGGNGMSGAIYEKMQLVADRALEIVSRCKCDESPGCPLCTYLLGCNQRNEHLSKKGAKVILETLAPTKTRP